MLERAVSLSNMCKPQKCQKTPFGISKHADHLSGPALRYPPVLDYEGKPLVIPKDRSQPEELHQKDMKALELIRQKVDRGEKVLIYTSWVRIDTQQKLLGLLAQRG